MIQVRISDEDAEEIIKHDAMWDYLTDDGSVAREDYKIPEAWMNVVGYVDESPAAFVCIVPLNYVTADIHFGVHPDYRDMSKELGTSILAWIWDNTEVLKLVAQTHADTVRDFALQVGFEIEGINAMSFMKNGKLIDQVYLGVKRCLQQQQ